jgi:putative membrane protein
MKPATLLLCGIAALVAGWSIAAATRAGMTGHMAAHMAAVAVAAPLIARAIAGARFDPAVRWPRIVAPLPMSVMELLVVWGWHLPAARAFSAASAVGLVLEQAMFFIAGLLLWSACLGAVEDADGGSRRAAGVIALLLTTMHMTLLGTLIALAPRTLYGTVGCGLFGLALPPLEDQQIGGVVMLLVGAGSYLVGGLVLLFRVLRNGERRAAVP